MKFILEYDGSRYHGWQRQPLAMSVQQAVEEALAVILRCREPVVGSGRTDAGVHAIGQVAHCSVPVCYSDEEIWRGVNRLLPSDIVLKGVETVPDSFHARRSARRKTYHYLILNQPIRPALLRQRYWWISYSLDVEAMREGLAFLPGRHDFKGFQGRGSSIQNSVREMFEARLEQEGERLKIVFTANGFLKQMVRNMVGTLVEIGRGRFKPERIREIIETGKRGLNGKPAPAEGLYFFAVEY